MGCTSRRSTPPATRSAAASLLKTVTYGFNGAYSQYFRDLSGLSLEIVDVPDPDSMGLDERRVARAEAEAAQVRDPRRKRAIMEAAADEVKLVEHELDLDVKELTQLGDGEIKTQRLHRRIAAPWC